MIKLRVLTVLIVLATLVLVACGPKKMSQKEAAAYAAEVDEHVENFLAGTSECDSNKAYSGFDKVEWGDQLNENTFQQECKADLAKLGAYVSKTVDRVEDRQEVRCVVYHLVFEKNTAVTQDVCFYIDDPEHLIVGLLRKE